MRSVTLLPLLLTACVTTHPGIEVASDHAAYSMSCAIRRDVDAEYFRLLACSFENKSADWMDVAVKSVEFPGLEREVHVSSVEETRDFAEAYAIKQQQDRSNTAAAFAVLALAGAAAGLSGGGRDVTDAGTGALVVGLTGLEAHEAGTAYVDAQYGKVEYAPGHLLTRGFRVAPGLAVRKGLLIQVPSDDVRPKTVDVCLAKPADECLTLPVLVGNGA